MKRSPIVDKNYNKLVEYRLEGLRKAGARHAGHNKKLKPRLFWPTVFSRGVEFPNGSVPVMRWQITSPFPAFTLAREALAALGRPVRVLDIGCGRGDLLYFLKACPEIDVAEYAGVDIADVTVDFPIYRSLLDVPKDERFDVIMMSEIIEHMPYADFVEEFLVHVGEYVAPGGALVLGAPNPLLPAMLERDVTHVQHYPWYDLYALLRFFFEDVTIVRAYGLAEFRRILALPLKILVSSILECDWCEGVLAVARKPKSSV
jgi:2-polyprenyl-3-methyl-5-hydroxy-6-metoxy-1,4-benzoquinol methylase